MTTPKKLVMFDELSSNEIAEAAKAGAAVILPLGSIEAHSTHLPLCTDSIQDPPKRSNS
jgi:creatinine amidohydrolase/Fe(II)-dependent formamide hydrolase-like protein